MLRISFTKWIALQFIFSKYLSFSNFRHQRFFWYWSLILTRTFLRNRLFKKPILGSLKISLRNQKIEDWSIFLVFSDSQCPRVFRLGHSNHLVTCLLYHCLCQCHSVLLKEIFRPGVDSQNVHVMKAHVMNICGNFKETLKNFSCWVVSLLASDKTHPLLNVSSKQHKSKPSNWG